MKKMWLLVLVTGVLWACNNNGDTPEKPVSPEEPAALMAAPDSGSIAAPPDSLAASTDSLP